MTRIAGRTRWLGVFTAAVATLLLCCAVAHARPPSATLTLRVSDGIVILDAVPERVDAVRTDLANAVPAPDTIESLAKWLRAHGEDAESIRLYFNQKRVVENAPTMRKRKWKQTTVRDAVMSGEAPCIMGRELFEAYMMIQSTGARMLLLSDEGEAEQSLKGLSPSVFVLSSAYGVGRTGIFVDGVDLSKNKAGYNVVTFSPDGAQVTGAESFELFEKPEDGPRMASFLFGQPEGAYAAVSVGVGPGVFFTADDIAALRSFGSAESLDPELLSSHALLGRKGFQPGGALEATAVNIPSKIIYFPSSEYVSQDKIDKDDAQTEGKVFIISGTAPDDPIYMLE